jgi:hypothetical protein
VTTYSIGLMTFFSAPLIFETRLLCYECYLAAFGLYMPMMIVLLNVKTSQTYLIQPYYNQICYLELRIQMDLLVVSSYTEIVRL